MDSFFQDSDDSNTSDLISSVNDNESSSPVSSSIRFSQQHQTAGGKAQRRRGLQAFQDQQVGIFAETNESNYSNIHNRRHTLCASAGGANPLLSTQPFAVCFCRF